MHDTHSLKRVQGKRDLKSSEAPVYARSMTVPASTGPTGSLSRRASMMSSSTDSLTIPDPAPVDNQSPINRLPNEILILIFEQGAHAGANVDLRYPLKPLSPPINPSFIQTITHVCHRWRHLAMTTSTLWSSPMVTRSSADVSNLPSISLWTKPLASLNASLRLSRECPLDITVNTAHMSTRTIILTQLSPHASRWRSLNILIPGIQSLRPLLHSLNEINASFPLLESFSITCTKPYGGENSPRIGESFPPFFLKCPNLRSITLRRVPLLPLSLFPPLLENGNDQPGSGASTPTSLATSTPFASPSTSYFPTSFVMSPTALSYNPYLTTLSLQFPLTPSFGSLRRLLSLLPHLEHLALHLDSSALCSVVPDTLRPPLPISNDDHAANNNNVDHSSDTTTTPSKPPRTPPHPRLKSLDLRFLYHSLIPSSTPAMSYYSYHPAHPARSNNHVQFNVHSGSTTDTPTVNDDDDNDDDNDPTPPLIPPPLPPVPAPAPGAAPTHANAPAAPAAVTVTNAIRLPPTRVVVSDTRNHYANLYTTPQPTVNPLPLLTHLANPNWEVLGSGLERLVLRGLNTTDWCRVLMWFGMRGAGSTSSNASLGVRAGAGAGAGERGATTTGGGGCDGRQEEVIGFGGLKQLRVEGIKELIYVDEEEVGRAFPALEELELVGVYSGAWGRVVRDGCNRKRKRNGEKKSGMRKEEGVLWPRLHTLSIKEDPSLKEELVLEAVKVRKEAGVGLRRVGFGEGEWRRLRKTRTGDGDGDLMDQLRRMGVEVFVI